MIEQRSPEWYAQRLGKATASRVADIIARTKSGYSTSRANYAADLITERLTGAPVLGFVSAAMIWGLEQEEPARALYADRCGLVVTPAEYVDHPEISWSGASPDGYVDSDGLVEIKCPLTAQHIDALLGTAVPANYLTQMQWQMACTGRLWCDYVSYDPRMPERMQLYVKRVPRDLSVILELETEVTAFLAEIEERVAKLAALYGQDEAA
jgi:putative phage-type endonuclease